MVSSNHCDLNTCQYSSKGPTSRAYSGKISSYFYKKVTRLAKDSSKVSYCNRISNSQIMDLELKKQYGMVITIIKLKCA